MQSHLDGDHTQLTSGGLPFEGSDVTTWTVGPLMISSLHDLCRVRGWKIL